MEALPCIADRMYEADRHLDRVGKILRSLRAPPAQTLLLGANTKRQQQPQPDALRASGASSRSRSTAQSSQTEVLHHERPKRGEQPAPCCTTSIIKRVGAENAGAGAKRVVIAGEEAEQVLEEAGERRRTPTEPLDEIPRADSRPQPVSSGSAVVFQPALRVNLGGIGVPKTLFRDRVIRTWWRGLSCGVCFAAGAWARDGNGVVGVLLALAAVCGEVVVHEFTSLRRFSY